MKNRIAFISDHASPLATIGGIDSGGQNVYVAEVASSLATQGYSIDIYTRRESIEIDEIVAFGPGVRVIHICAGPAKIIPKEELYIYMEEFTEQMINFIEEENITYDLVHAHFWLSGMVATEIKKRLHLPFVITFHALGAVRKIHQGEADRFPDKRMTVEQDIMWHAEKIIAECPNDMKDLIELYHAPQDKIEIIPCGYNPEDFYPIEQASAKRALLLEPERNYILQLGRIVPRKGIDNVIEAFGRIHDKLPELRLLVVGGNTKEIDTDEEFIRLKNLCTDFDIQDKVSFLGQKSRDELKYYYSAADLFISTPWYEPFGITPLESMACGTPVIGSDVGGIAFTVRKNRTGDLVPPRQPEQLAEKILNFMNDKERIKNMGEKAIQHVAQNFTWKIVSQKISELYQQVIPAHRDFMQAQSLKNYFHEASQVFIRSANLLPPQIVKVAKEMVEVLERGNKILICGNGGSAAESQHFVAELVGRFEIPNRPAYPVISLNTDTAVLTAWANDYGYEYVFQRQVEALGQRGDMLICLSSSGQSPNLINALRQANEQELITVNLLGKDGGEAAQYGDYNLIVPAKNTARIQEVQLHIVHQLCGLVENQLCNGLPQLTKKAKKLTA